MARVPSVSSTDFIIKVASSKLSIDELLDETKKLNSKDTVLQIFDPENVINRIHLIGAYANAVVAFKNRTNKTKSMALEMLLFAAMTDQINVAIEKMGAKSNSRFIIFSNNKGQFKKISRFLTNAKDLNPSKARITAIAKKFNINSRDTDAFILQSITLSRLSEQ